MRRLPRLTDSQRRRLSRLEPRLRDAVRTADLAAAKRITAEIQSLLRPTGHETRIMHAKVWLFEAAMETGDLAFAIRGLTGVRQKVSRRTRIYLEATALLAICYIRQQDLVSAGPLMHEALVNDDFIRSARSRRQFRRRILQRFDEEGALAALIGQATEPIDAHEVHARAVKLLQNFSEDEMFAQIGDALPQQVRDFLAEVDHLARKGLPSGEHRYLPPPRHLMERGQLGRTVVGSLRRVLWRTLCDPQSDIYQAWVKEGVGAVLNKGYIAGALAATLSGMGIGLTALAVSATALVMKFGIEVICDRYAPQPVMDARGRR